VVYSAIPLGSSLMCFRFLQVTVSFIRTGELPHHDHGHVDGLDEVTPPVDVNPYGLDDNLHMHDLKHTMLGERRSGDERRQGEPRGEKPTEGGQQ
jgi:C4-dicarboxylate transporter, DctQ subunit